MRQIMIVLCVMSVAACSPTVKVAAPDKPIEIQLHIRIEQEIKVKIDKELDEAFEQAPGVF